MKRETATKPRTRVQRNTRTEVIDDETTKQERRRLEAELDEMLDEVDAILEENEEVLSNYTQRGGQ